MNAADSNPPATFSKSQERSIVWLLCLLAAVHVFVFSAAFPFFNTVDEQIHFDLAVKYSQGHVPRALEPFRTEATPYVIVYGSHEYLWASNNFPAEQFPPPWTQPMEKVGAQSCSSRQAAWNKVINHEASQPPLYYALAGLWWRAGNGVRIHDGFLLYWLRFLNVFVVAALVWLGFAAARMVFPGNRFLRLGVPALLAFIPQSAFYSIQNDVLSPLAFGVAFICLVKLLRAEMPGRPARNSHRAGAGGDVPDQNQQPASAGRVRPGGAVQNCGLARSGKLRAAGPALAALALCAGLPMMAWLAWCKYHLRRFHRHGGQNPVSRLDAQTVRRMVASSDFHAARFVDVRVGTHGDVLAGRVSLASPAAGLAGRGHDLRHFIRRSSSGWR